MKRICWLCLPLLLAGALEAAVSDDAWAVVSRYRTVFDAPPRETPSNAAVDGPLLGNGDALAVLAGTPEQPAWLLTTNDFWLLKHGAGGPRPFGRLALDLPSLAGANWRAEQDLAHGTTELRLSREGTALRLRSWVAATENALVVELSAEGQPVAAKAGLHVAGGGGRLVDDDHRVNLGREQWGNGRWVLDGRLDELRVYDRGLSAAEVGQLAAKAEVNLGLVRHWSFDEEGEVAQDVSGHGGDGKVIGARRVPGLRGRALEFDGQAGYVDCPPLRLAKAVTLSAWVWINAHAPTGSAQYVFSKGEWNHGYSLGLSEGHLRFAVGGRYVQGAGSVPTGRWVHLAGTYADGTLKAYVDGVDIAPAAATDGAEEGAQPGLLWAVRRFDKADLPTVCAGALRLPGDNADFTVTPGQPVTLVVAPRSGFKSQAPLADAQRAAVADVPALRTAHEAWWRAFWGESFVDIDDPVLMQRYYQTQYVMASCSRDPDFPPCIFGWATTDNPAWQGDYHLNYNHMAPFYALASSGHFAQLAPHDTPLLDFSERGRWYAKTLFGTRGQVLPVGIGPKGIETTRGGRVEPEGPHRHGEGLFYGQKSNMAYAVVNMANRWYASYDLAYARRVYPFVRDCAEFWEDWLKLEDGRYVIHKDSIHEGSGTDLNPILSLGLVPMVLKVAIDMGRELGVDRDRHAAWQDRIDRLSRFTTQERNGKTVFRYTERGTAWWGDNTLGIQHIFPSGAIGLDSDPRLLEVSRNTLAVMGRWHDFNGMNSLYPACVRVGYDPAEILTHLHEMVASIGRPNGFIKGNPHGIEHCSTTPSTLNEMMLLSHEGVLRLFKVWPRERDARFGDLRAKGAFRVSATLKGAVVGGVAIVSERGRECVVENPWPGQSVVVTRDGRAAEVLSGERVRFGTTAGERVELAGR